VPFTYLGLSWSFTATTTHLDRTAPARPLATLYVRRGNRQHVPIWERRDGTAPAWLRHGFGTPLAYRRYIWPMYITVCIYPFGYLYIYLS